MRCDLWASIRTSTTPDDDSGQVLRTCRIVYRLLPSDENPDFAQVIAVGAKPGVYWKASLKLERG